MEMRKTILIYMTTLIWPEIVREHMRIAVTFYQFAFAWSFAGFFIDNELG